MQIRIFTIPILGGEIFTDEMNVFLRAKKVLNVKEHLINNDVDGAFWCFCVQYVDDLAATEREKGKVEYRDLLDEASFKRFRELRDIRRRVAQDDAVPAYAVFTDAELAEFAKLDALTPEAIKSLKGIGEKRLEKYGRFFLSQTPDEKGQ